MGVEGEDVLARIPGASALWDRLVGITTLVWRGPAGAGATARDRLSGRSGYGASPVTLKPLVGVSPVSLAVWFACAPSVGHLVGTRDYPKEGAWAARQETIA